jgi:hypothetical protein
MVLQKPFTTDDLAKAVAGLIDRAAAEHETVTKIQARAHSQCLRELLLHWVAKPSYVLVHFAKFDPDLCTEPRNLVVVKVDPTHAPMRFKFVSAHEELETILGRPLTGTELDGPGAEGFGSIEES